MKKYIILFVLLLPSAVFGFSPMFIGGGGSSGGAPSCDDCSGTVYFSWHMESTDVTAGDPCGCSDSDTEAALTDATISNTQKYDGINSLYWADAGDYAEFDVSINADNITIKGRVYIDHYTADTRIIALEYDVNNRIFIRMTGGDSSLDFLARYIHGGTAASITCTGDRGEDEWIYFEYQAKVGVEGNDHYLKMCDSDGVSNCATAEEDDDLVSWGNNATKLYIGNNDTPQGIVYADAYVIDLTSKY